MKRNQFLRVVSLIVVIAFSFTYILSPSIASAAQLLKYLSKNSVTEDVYSQNNTLDETSGDTLSSPNLSEISQIESDRFIIKFKSGKKEKGKEKIKAALDKKIISTKEIKNKNYEMIITDTKKNSTQLLEEINANEEIEYIQPDFQLKLHSTDTLLDEEQWGLQSDIGANVIPAWEESEGEGVVIAVIDTGIDILHEDLADNIWVNTEEIPNNGIDDDNNDFIDDVSGWDFYHETNNVNCNYDENEWHGTHVAGIIAAVKDNDTGVSGVAPKAQIMPLKAFADGVAYTTDIINAICYAEIMGAKVVNCSWGGTIENMALKEVMDDANMLFVCAAGNSGNNLAIEPEYPAVSKIDNAIVVGSFNNQGILSSFSNYSLNYVDVAAPGEDIISTLPGNKYGQNSGTSMAAAFVTGAASLLLSKYPNLTNISLKQNIIEGSDKKPELQDKIMSGNRINCVNAINCSENSAISQNTTINDDGLENINTVTGDVYDSLISLMSSDEIATDYDKYFSAPYDVKDANDEYIDYASGSLKIEKTLFSLPGRNHLDLNLLIRYDSANANLYECVWRYHGLGDPLIRNYTTSYSYLQTRDKLGPGWSFDFSSIEIIETEEGFDKYLHLGNGSTYKVITTTEGDLTLKDYSKKDLELKTDNKSFTSGSNSSSYVLIHKDGKKEYFEKNGSLLGIVDRYDNTIKFEYTSVNGNSVILITDSLNRVTKIIYENTSTGKKVTILEPDSTLTDSDNTRTQLFLEQTPDSSYILHKIVDQKNRETIFNYNYETGMFNFFDGGILLKQLGDNYIFIPSFEGQNKYVNLASITYPTTATTEYTFEKTSGNLGSKGIYEFYRIKTREDVDNSQIYNKKTFNYSDKSEGNNHTGYPAVRDPDELPEEFEYSTEIVDENNKKEIYTFNNKHLNIKEETKIIDGEEDILLKEVTNTYETDTELPDLETTVIYGYNGDNLTATGSSLTKTNDYDYNEYGDLMKITDQDGRVEEYAYDPKYHQTSLEKKKIDNNRWMITEHVINPDNGNVTQTIQHFSENGVSKTINTLYPTYDSCGNVKEKKIQKKDGTYIEESYEYSSTYNYGYLTQKTIRVKDYTEVTNTIEELYSYDFNSGRLATYTNGRTYPTSYFYDDLGRQTKVINPDNSEISINFNDTANEVIVIFENGYQRKNLYDGLGRLKKQQEMKDGQWVTLKEQHYNPEGQIQWEKDGKNNQTSFEYDIFGRVKKTTNPDTTFKQVKYYDVENKKKEIDEEGKEKTSYYDNAGNLIKSIVKPDQNQTLEYVTINQYDYLNNLIYTKDPKGYETHYNFDELGRLIEVVNANNEKTYYKYDNLNNVTNIIQDELDSNGNIISHSETVKEYDEKGRLIAKTDPLLKTEYFKYDNCGNIDHQKDREGQVISYTYDVMDRPLTKIAKDKNGNIEETITYNYSRRYSENILEITDSRGLVEYLYYPNGKLKKETQPDGKNISYEYDNNGNRKKIKDPYELTVEYIYNERNLLDNVIVNQVMTFEYEYYDNGMLESITYPNQVVANYTYDDANRLDTLTNVIGTENSLYDYDYDANSNITSVNENNNITNYQYDPLNRLEIIDRAYNNQSIQYSYDNRGNRKQEVRNCPSPYIFTDAQFTFNALNQLVQFNNNYYYQYDYNGFRAEKKKIDGGITTEFARYFNDSTGRVITEADVNGNVVSQIIWADKPLAIKKGSAYYYYVYNGHGDVVKLVDGSGTIVNSYTYDEWGNIVSKNETITNPIRYAAGYYDEESGLYYLMARYYDPTVGRFISEDSVEGQLTNPLSLNQYIYCFNDPLKYLDENGHFGILATIALGALTGAIFDIGKQLIFDNKSFSNLNWESVGKSALIGGIGGSVAFGIGKIGASMYSIETTSSFRYGLGTSALSGSITNTIGDSLINNNIDSPGGFLTSAVSGAFGGAFGYGVSYLGGNVYKNLIFDNMPRNAQRDFMRSAFGIRSNISYWTNQYSYNSIIANYYSNNSWLIGGTSNIFSEVGINFSNYYMPTINSYFNNSWNWMYTYDYYSYRYNY